MFTTEILFDTKERQDYDKKMDDHQERLTKDQSIDLPIEVYLKIFSYLPPRDMLTVDLVCKKFNTTTFWENIFHIFLPTYQQSSLEKNSDYKKNFQIYFERDFFFPHLYQSTSNEKIYAMSWEQKIVSEKLLGYLVNNATSRRNLSYYRNSFFYNPSYYNNENQISSTRELAATTLKKVICNEADENKLDPFLPVLTDEKMNPNLASIYKQSMAVHLISCKETRNDYVLANKV